MLLLTQVSFYGCSLPSVGLCRDRVIKIGEAETCVICFLPLIHLCTRQRSCDLAQAMWRKDKERKEKSNLLLSCLVLRLTICS